jgi:hypothetical protein
LFLIRAYNDLDHFSPVIWKALSNEYRVYIVFTDKWEGGSYLTSFLKNGGAEAIRIRWLQRYHWRIKPRLRLRWVSCLADVVFGFIPCVLWLIRSGLPTVVVEWGGISGRELARYFLVPGRVLGLRLFSLPHGYHIWRNQKINDLMVALGEDHSAFDFSERNRFTRVVAQSGNIKKFFLDRKIRAEKLVVLGSARFSKEWTALNLKLALDSHPEPGIPFNKPLVLVFLGTWEYRMDKDACLEMIKALGDVRGVNVLIKGHSRGSKAGGLLDAERGEWLSETIHYAADSIPSNVLIHHAKAIVNYGSSIGIEAVVQRKPLCNATFVTENTTIFDESGVTFDAHSVKDVIRFVTDVVESPDMATMTDEARSAFLKEHVYAGQAESRVLDSHLELLAGQAR